MNFVRVISALTLLSASAANAQDVFYWPAPASSGGTAQKSFFPMGTPLKLITRTEINTKQAKPGDRVYLEVAESLTYQGQVVVPIGSPVVGEVARSERNGHFGKRGEIDVRLLYVQTPSGPVRLTGQTSDTGTDAAVWSVATMVLVSGLGFLIHGTSGYIPFGTVVTSYLAEPLQFYRQPAPAAVATVQPDQAYSTQADYGSAAYPRPVFGQADR